MSQDTFEIIKKMDKNDIEMQLALQCAPFIMGLRISNLFNVCHDNFEKLKRLLKNTDVSYEILFDGKEKITLFLYNSKMLEAYMKDTRVQQILIKLEYVDLELEALFEVFKERYIKYMQGKAEFPHEMGLFLGYPIEDVIGYIRNKGENSLFTGYWKVYENISDKMKLFEKFECAKEAVIRYIAHGVSILDVIAI